MDAILALLIGFLAATGLYCLLRRALTKLVIGLILLGQAVNLLVFLAGGLIPGSPPILGADGSAPAAPFADPLPQALVLTAIVISFGLTVFVLILVQRSFETARCGDIDSFNRTDAL